MFLVCLVVAWTSGEGSASAQVAGETTAPLFRIEREPIDAGGELLTVFGRPDAGINRDGNRVDGQVPLVSMLRDTLGDGDSENDRLRYVWVHGYGSPSAAQRIASAIPFLNRRTGNRKLSEEPGIPPSVIDLGAPARELWRHALWTVAQYTVFDPYGVIVKTSVRAFRRNDDDYRKAHVLRALAILALFEVENGATSDSSPMPQLALERIENNGTLTPACRPLTRDLPRAAARRATGPPRTRRAREAD
jgi:hypothetical protein